MLAKIIFFIAVTAAILVVVLLALPSPSPNSAKPQKEHSFALSLYIQPVRPLKSPQHQQQQQQQQRPPTALHDSSRAFIFNHNLTKGPKSTSRVIGHARGLVLPVKNSALAIFNMICISVYMPEYSGSIVIEARMGRWRGDTEELAVVGGTGSFAFARGVSHFVQTRRQQFCIKLRLILPQ